jgi:voltage-gated potassium channel Kch
MQPPGFQAVHDLQLRWGSILGRGLAFLAVFLAGFVGLSLGVEVSERDISEAGPAARAYYALGLFVLGGLDLGTPHGGSALGIALLWASYFLAPVITASALLEAAFRMMAPLALRVRRLKDHVVIAGAGGLALLYLRKLRQTDRRTSVVVVDRNPSNPHLGELHDVYGAVLVTGDITSDAVLSRLQLGRARRALLLTGDDFSNLDAAAKMLHLAPQLGGRIVVHVADLDFLRRVAETSVARACETFNSHEFAAVYLVREHLVKRFESTAYRDLVILAGFGRFGQTVLHQLQEHARGLFGSVVIVDFDAAQSARLFAEQSGFAPGYEREIIDGDLRDPLVCRRISEAIQANGREPVIVVGSGDDGTNLQAALSLIRAHPGAYVIARRFRPSPFGAEVSRDSGVQPFNLADLVSRGMPERWFG